MKKRTSIAMFGLLLVVAAAVGFFLASDIVFDLDFGIIRERKISSSVATLQQVKNVLSLNTVEVVRKTVFPYDFVPSEMDWDLFFREAEKRQLSAAEEVYLDTYRVCEEIGINLRSKRREFVVITAIMKAGFDLSNPVFRSPELAGEELAQRYVSTDGSGGISILLPRAIITDLILEDAESASYQYPDIEIGPANWRTLTSFVRERIVSTIHTDEVLDLARENGRQFLERLFLDAGYSSVTFLQ